MSVDQTGLDDCTSNVTFDDRDHLARKIFKEVVPHFDNKKISYGPDKDGKEYTITVKDNDGVALTRIPLT